MSSATDTPTRLPGLDGLRAIAVALVLACHLFPQGPLPGGFVGVDVFFVISGFLITTLLLRERTGHGRIDLLGFWRRRARRLIPALVIVLATCTSVAGLIGGDILTRVGEQLVGAMTFSYNWVSIAAGSAYFDAGTPELFRNLWSLAVEEQFYLLWPLLLPLVVLLPRCVARAGLAVLGAAASAWAMAMIVSGGGPEAVTRAYFGTGTHAFGLLLGAALALLPPRTMRAAGRPTRVIVTTAGVGALGGIIAIATLGESATIRTFPGALLTVSALTAVVIAAAIWPGVRWSRALDAAPLRWIGARSYGLYLWHWPLALILLAAATGSIGGTLPVPLGIAALVLSLVAAAASYRFVELPIRRHGFARAWRLLIGRLRAGPRARLQVIATFGAIAVVVGGTSAAIAAAPAQTTAQSAVDAGARALTDTPAPLRPAGAPTPSISPAADAPISGDQVTAVGDSVMLASAGGLLARFPGVWIDAEESRSMWAGVRVIEDLAARGELRRYVVVGLGTNGPVDTAALDELEQTVGPDRELVLVNAVAPRDWIPGVNDALRGYTDGHRGVYLADWAGHIAPHADLLAGDGIHPGEAGGRVYADAVAGAFAQIAEAHADRRARFQLAVARLTAAPPR